MTMMIRRRVVIKLLVCSQQQKQHCVKKMTGSCFRHSRRLLLLRVSTSLFRLKSHRTEGISYLKAIEGSIVGFSKNQIGFSYVEIRDI